MSVVAKVVCLIVLIISAQAELACTPDQPAECKEFFQKSMKERQELLRTFPVTKQLQLYRCGMSRRPPTIGMAYQIAEGGEKIIPDLTAALRSEKDEWMQYSIIQVFRVLSMDGHLRGKDSTVQEIRETISRMKFSRIKKESEDSLKEIENFNNDQKQ